MLYYSRKWKNNAEDAATYAKGRAADPEERLVSLHGLRGGFTGSLTAQRRQELAQPSWAQKVDQASENYS